MSYVLTVTGTTRDDGPPTPEEVERHVADAARAFVEELPNVDSAIFVGSTIGTLDLRERR